MKNSPLLRKAALEQPERFVEVISMKYQFFLLKTDGDEYLGELKLTSEVARSTAISIWAIKRVPVRVYRVSKEIGFHWLTVPENGMLKK